MKQWISLLILTFTSFSQAAILEVSEPNKTVYLTYTPQLQMDVQDIGSNAYLYLTLSYDGAKAQQEIDSAKTQYPGYEIKIVNARPNGKLQLKIGDFYARELDLAEQMSGLYLNIVDKTTPTELTRMKALGKNLASEVSIVAPAQVSYQSLQVVEEYRLKGSFCEKLNVKSVRDLISGFSSFKRPADIQHDETFQDLKLNALASCFDVQESRIGSFKDLMGLGVQTLSPSTDLVGRYSEKREKSRSIELKPSVLVNW